MTVESELALERSTSLNSGPPTRKNKSLHNRTQSISTTPLAVKKQHRRRGSLPAAIHILESNSESPIRSPIIPTLPEKGAISIHIANPKSDVIAASHFSHNSTHKTAIKNISYILTWYFFSTSLSLYNKNLMGRDRFNFNFPLLVSAIHAGIHSIITTLMMWFGGNRWKNTSGVSMSLNDYLYKVVSGY
jgi:hypothetical protein